MHKRDAAGGDGRHTAGVGGDPVLAWLLDGDVAVAYQATRDLLGRDDPALQARIATEGHGAALLAAQGPEGHWGRGFYQPKWTCSHYTLLELKNLGLHPTAPRPRQAVARILAEGTGPDGGLNPSGTVRASDVCINGMALGYAAYFGADTALLAGIVDFVLGQRMPDGGFNCRSNRSGARHSSVHSTTSVLEGVTEYLRRGHEHRARELETAAAGAVEFLLRHRLYRSERTGAPIHPELTRLHHPSRWYYDVLRGLDALRDAGVDRDPRMGDALDLLRRRRRPDGRWVVNRAYPGASHVPAPQAGRPDPWITLGALRVLARYDRT